MSVNESRGEIAYGFRVLRMPLHVFGQILHGEVRVKGLPLDARPVGTTHDIVHDGLALVLRSKDWSGPEPGVVVPDLHELVLEVV